MMWLGIVLHVGCIHTVQQSALPWRDEQRTPVADLLVGFIHAFRMPLFFILAGFFAALLLQSRGPAGMAQHRLRRLGLPFLLFWPPAFVLIVVFALLFVHRMVMGSWGIDPGLMPRTPGVPEPGLSTAHLWFLWMLLWLSLFAALAAALHARLPTWRGFERAGHALQHLGAAWWGFALLALPLVWTGWDYPNGIVVPNQHFLPPLAEWVHNGLFFVFGLALFHRQQLFALYQRRWWSYALVGLLFFLVCGALMERQVAAGWIAFVYSAASWLWCFALLGVGTRWLARRQRVLAYLADSSYWVYLAHFPLTIGFGALLFGQPLPALAKMAINIAATTTVCLVSYQLAVRSTWIGALLNGKRHPRQASGDALARPAGEGSSTT
jgi:hypothetical protein